MPKHVLIGSALSSGSSNRAAVRERERGGLMVGTAAAARAHRELSWRAQPHRGGDWPTVVGV